jgi:hypothetical protein
LARNPVDGGALIWAMEESKLRSIVTPQRAFVNTGNDKFWMQLEFGMAKKYVDDLSDNVKRGLRAKISQGWKPGRPPVGYQNELISKTIVKDPDRFPKVRKMWDLMLTGNYSPLKILQIATERWGLRTKMFSRMGGCPLALSAVYKLFSNPFYYGQFVHRGETLQGGHEPMVTTAEFNRVQELLGTKSRPRPKHYTFTYGGLLRCGECEAAITAENKVNRYGSRYTYYHCTKRKRHIRCGQRSVEQRTLERQIASFLSTITTSRRIHDLILRLLKEVNREENQKELDELASLHARYEACHTSLGKLVSLRLDGLLTDDEFLAKKRELEAERLRLMELLGDKTGRQNNIIKRCEEAFEFARKAQKLFERGTQEQKRAILSYCGSNLVLKDGRIAIEPQKPFLAISEFLRATKAKNPMFEPLKMGVDKTKTATGDGGFRALRGLVEDVRTFYWENRNKLSFLGLPTILHFRKTSVR